MYKAADKVSVSSHGFRRLQERNSWNREVSIRMSARIWENGKRLDEIKGYTRKWIQKISRFEDREIVVYGDLAYVFDSVDRTLITVLRIPSKATIYKSLLNKNSEVESA